MSLMMVNGVKMNTVQKRNRFGTRWAFSTLIVIILLSPILNAKSKSSSALRQFHSTASDIAEIYELLKGSAEDLNVMPIKRSLSNTNFKTYKQFTRFCNTINIPIQGDFVDFPKTGNDEWVSWTGIENTFSVGLHSEKFFTDLIKQLDIEQIENNYQANLKSTNGEVDYYSIMELAFNQKFIQHSDETELQRIARFDLLSLKYVLRGPTEEASVPRVFYSFSVNDYRGFQFGTPETSEVITVYLVNKRNQVLETNFIIGDNDSVTQEHIDFIIRTTVIGTDACE